MRVLQMRVANNNIGELILLFIKVPTMLATVIKTNYFHNFWEFSMIYYHSLCLFKIAKEP